MGFRSFITTVTTLITAVASFSAEVAIFPVEVTNLTQSQGDAIGTVMAQQYARLLGKPVLTPGKTVAAVQADSGNLTAAAQRLGVQQFVAMNAVALSSKIMLEAVLYDITGRELFRTQMTAASLDDISDVSDRMAGALIQRVSTEVTMTLDNITEREGQDKNRTSIEKVKGFKVQFIAPFDPDAKIETMAALGFDMRVEGKNFFLEFGAAPFFPASGISSTERNAYGGAYIEMGGDYYIVNNKTISPYVGGGVSPRIIFGTSADFMTIGIAPYIQGGIMLFRYSKMRLYADVRVAKNVMPLAFGGRYESYTDENGYYQSRYAGQVKTYPWEIGMSIGMGW